MTDDELMEYADSRMMKYPDVLQSTDKFESEESTDQDKAYALADLITERGYPGPSVDRFTLASHILKKWKELKDAAEDKKENVGGFDQ